MVHGAFGFYDVVFLFFFRSYMKVYGHSWKCVFLVACFVDD